MRGRSISWCACGCVVAATHMAAAGVEWRLSAGLRHVTRLGWRLSACACFVVSRAASARRPPP
eukprot:7119540-Prymnesium_polylepis.1